MSTSYILNLGSLSHGIRNFLGQNIASYFLARDLADFSICPLRICCGGVWETHSEGDITREQVTLIQNNIIISLVYYSSFAGPSLFFFLSETF
jgi:hypothetical protein